MAEFMTDAMGKLDTPGGLIYPEHILRTVKQLASLPKAEYRKLKKLFKTEQPVIHDSIASLASQDRASKDQTRELNRIALVTWVTFKINMPELPEVTKANWELATISGHEADELDEVSSKQALAVLAMMLTYRLKHPEIMELERGVRLFACLATMVCALDFAYLCSNLGITVEELSQRNSQQVAKQ
jgi:hypothetical protein